MIGTIRVGMLVLLAAGCAVESQFDRSHVAKGIRERTGYRLGQAAAPGKFSLPEGISLEDGLSEDEAVALALWNNAQLQADLAALGFSRADLAEANMWPNPVFSVLFPVGPKLLETKLNLPIDVLWQRPRRVAAAKLDAESLAENLVEHGLGLIRNVRTTYADLWLAQERARLADEDSRILIEVADLASTRLRAGDISQLAASGDRVDALRAADTTTRLLADVQILKQRLHVLLGLGPPRRIPPFDLTPLNVNSPPAPAIDGLLETALAARPDLRAAELRIEAAGQRLGWERSRIYNLIAIIDGKDKGVSGQQQITVGPGLQFEIPVFNQGGGRIARAKAELEQAARQYEAVRQNILLQVREAYTQYTASREALSLWLVDVIASSEEADEQTRQSFAAGEASYLLVLHAKKKVIGARMRQMELTADLHRSAAQLNYCVGKRIM